MVVQQK